MGRRRKRTNGPPPGNGAYAFTAESGEPVYHTPMPAVKTRVRLLPGNKCEILAAAPPLSPGDVLELSANIPRDTRPLLPASEEVAQLPKLAREAFGARCAARVARLRPNAATPEAAAALILAAATVGTPIRRQLLCVRRDFDRIAYLVKKHNWTDDTPVPPNAFGPMWPKGLTPDWAKEPPGAS